VAEITAGAARTGGSFSQPAVMRYAAAPMGAVSDEELMLRYCNGDTAAFEALYAKHKGGVFRYLMRQTDAQVAPELHQEVWMSVVRHQKNYQPTARFNTYLYTIAHNRVIDHYRSSNRRIPSSYHDTNDCEAVAPLQHDPAVGHELKQQVQVLLAGIAKLPAAQREAFLLREEAGLSLDDIAAVTGSSRETIKSRLRYAVGKLRQLLLETEHDEQR